MLEDRGNPREEEIAALLTRKLEGKQLYNGSNN
jgi:hypothetical protein